MTSGWLTIMAATIGVPAASAPPPRSVAITFDDLPFADPAGPDAARAARRANASIRRTLRTWRVPAIGFVTANNATALRHGPALLRAWRRAGLELGNHGAMHADSNMLDLEGIEREIAAGEVGTIEPRDRRSGHPRFYRFAYNHVGDTEAKRVAIEALLARRGYRLAASTIDTSDYVFDQAYRRAAGDRALRGRIEQAYLAYTLVQIRYYAVLNRQVLGREPPAVMLLHLNALNAATLERLLRLFRAEGYGFASLGAAQADPAYRESPRYATRYGPMWGYRWAREQAVKVDGRAEQEPPEWIRQLADAR